MRVPPHQDFRTALRGTVLPVLGVIAFAPVAFIAYQIILTSRNVPFWDDYDSVLGFLLQLDSGATWNEFFQRLLRFDSGHRTVVSRILFAGSYWLTGGVNFHFISIIGNLTLVGLCFLLIARAGDVAQRARMGVVLALGLFHLQHYEPFFWGGASIDHFQILLLAGGALAALTRPSPNAVAAATLLGVLATFTLAHGCVIWPVGALILIHQRRWHVLGFWGGFGAAAVAVFLHGFTLNPAHTSTDFSPAGLGRLLQFWLALLGGPLALGDRAHAPVLGVVLLALLGWLGARGAFTRQPLVMALALFAVGSLALIAFGRLGMAGDHIQSRYLVVASLAWSLAVFLATEQWTDPARPYRLLAYCLPALIVFNLASDFNTVDRAETFLHSRDYPAICYKQFGNDSNAGPFRLHPDEGTAENAIAAASNRGIYRFPRFCFQRHFEAPQPNANIVNYVADLTATTTAVGFEGWAMLPAQRSKRGTIHVVLRAAKTTLYFTTLSVPRPDVAKAFKEPLWHYCGYNFALLRHRLPDEDFQIGLLLADGNRTEYVMTDKWLRLSDPALKSEPLASDR